MPIFAKRLNYNQKVANKLLQLLNLEGPHLRNRFLIYSEETISLIFPYSLLNTYSKQFFNGSLYKTLLLLFFFWLGNRISQPSFSVWKTELSFVRIVMNQFILPIVSLQTTSAYWQLESEWP